MESPSQTRTTTLNATPKAAPPMIYMCGQCNQPNEIRPKDQIRCRECGHRVLYKKRSRNLLVYDGR